MNNQPGMPLQALLNAFAQRIVAVDSQAHVQMANQAWLDFMTQHLTPPAQGWMGTDYLDLHHQLEALGYFEFDRVQTYLRLILDRNQDTCQFEYCLGEGMEAAWFCMRFRAIEHDGHRWCIITHQDITQIHQSQEILNRYKQIVSHTPDGISLLDKDYRYQIVNDAYEWFSGASRGQFIGASIAEYLGQEIFETSIKPAFDRCLKGETVRFQSWFEYPTLGQRYVEVTYFPYRDVDNRITGIVANTRDITERKQAEDQLERSNAVLRAIIEAAPAAIIGLDPEGKVQLVWNPAAEKMLGWTAEEVMGKPIPSVPEECRQQSLNLLNQNLQGQILNGVEVHRQKQDGTPIDYSIYASPLHDSQGQAYGNIAVLVDITERKRIENALHQSEERFDLAMKASRDGLFDWNLVTDEIYYSPGWKRMVGYEDHELPNHISTWENLVAPEDQRRTWVMQQEILDKKRDHFKIELRLHHKQGHWVDVLSRADPIYGDNGEVIRIIGTHTDITEAKALERQLLDSQAQLKTLTSALTLTEERLKKTVAIRLHDNISQSLAMTRVQAGVLAQSTQDSNTAEALWELYQNLGRIIEDSQTLTTDLSFPALHLFGFEEAVRKWAEVEITGKHGLNVDLQTDGQAKPLSEDVRVMLFRGVRELLTNVVKHAQATHVDITITQQEHLIQIKIHDNGVGFKEGTLHKNHGFGVLSVSETLERMGGSLRYDSRSQQGCTVMMTAPLDRPGNSVDEKQDS